MLLEGFVAVAAGPILCWRCGLGLLCVIASVCLCWGSFAESVDVCLREVGFAMRLQKI